MLIYTRFNLEVDYEQQSSYSLTLEAKDGGNRSTHVVILVEIIDVNDNPPVFNSLEYKRTIREGGTEFQPKFFVQVMKDYNNEYGFSVIIQQYKINVPTNGVYSSFMSSSIRHRTIKTIQLKIINVFIILL